MKSVEDLGLSPTPWKNPHWKNKNNSFVFDENNIEVAIVSGDCQGKANANAALIAAAPELYECLRELYYWTGRVYDTGNDESEMIYARIEDSRGRAYKAIAKAAGEVK